MMATTNGAISDDGNTVTYSVDVRLTGTAKIAKQPCEHCGGDVLRSKAMLSLGGGSEVPVVIERCVQMDCKPLTSGDAASL